MPVPTPYVVPAKPRVSTSLLVGPGRDLHVQAGLPARTMLWFSLGRNALYHGTGALGLGPGDKVLVPAYHCATAIEPLRRRGLEVEFYKIRDDCVIDARDIARRIDRSTRAIMAIHYFGFPQELSSVLDLCKAHNIYFIEDCAHVLFGRSGDHVLGGRGDISVFSWRKFLPVHDGGLLATNIPAIEVRVPRDPGQLLFDLRAAKNTIESLVDSSDVRAVHRLIRMTSAFYRRISRRGGHTASSIRRSRGDTHTVQFDTDSANLRMSSVSRRIARRANPKQISEKRRVNYMALRDVVESIPTIRPVFRDLPENNCPLAYPVIWTGSLDLNKTLRSMGIPSFAWDGVIHPSLRLAEHPEAEFLYRNLVLLPLHQDVTEHHIVTIADALERVATVSRRS